jgi:hypothetical protein
MKQIDRAQAEQFLQEFEVQNSTVKQTKSELRISFNLSNKKSILVVYNTLRHLESFFIDELD